MVPKLPSLQSKIGKAFEWVCLHTLKERLELTQRVEIPPSSALSYAENAFITLDTPSQQRMLQGALAGIQIILQLEPRLIYPQSQSPLLLSLQEDNQGIQGDVRDILCRRDNWEIGISCKHNHSAIKHSRLSQDLDFGQSWFQISCTPEYFQAIQPIFMELKELKQKNVLWREVRQKKERIYAPLAKAFMQEIVRLDRQASGVLPERLIHYLLGRHDFYKLIMMERKKMTQIQAFNINQTLTRPSGNHKSPFSLKVLPMPHRLIDIDFKPKSQSTLLIACDEGWTVSLRLHNAETKVIPSLKFDVQLLGIPASLYSHYEFWKGTSV